MYKSTDTPHIKPCAPPMKWFYTDNVSEFIHFIEGVGLDYLEDEKLFCLLFQLYEEDSDEVDFNKVLDYKEVLDIVDPDRRSCRIFEYAHIAFNVGNKVEYMKKFTNNIEKSFNSLGGIYKNV